MSEDLGLTTKVYYEPPTAPCECQCINRCGDNRIDESAQQSDYALAPAPTPTQQTAQPTNQLLVDELITTPDVKVIAVVLKYLNMCAADREKNNNELEALKEVIHEKDLAQAAAQDKITAITAERDELQKKVDALITELNALQHKFDVKQNDYATLVSGVNSVHRLIERMGEKRYF